MQSLSLLKQTHFDPSAAILGPVSEASSRLHSVGGMPTDIRYSAELILDVRMLRDSQQGVGPRWWCVFAHRNNYQGIKKQLKNKRSEVPL